MLEIWKTLSWANATGIRYRLLGHPDTRKIRYGMAGILIIMGLYNPYLRDHSIGVASFGMKLAQRLGFSSEQIALIRKASLLHDIGKLKIPKAILGKPASLSSGEYEVVKTHPVSGAALLRTCPGAQALMPIVRHHHERFDGQGYPDQIAGDQIEIETRVISIADAIDAMRTNRPYRRALSLQQIIHELRVCAMKQFDPQFVEPAILTLKDMETLSEKK